MHYITKISEFQPLVTNWLHLSSAKEEPDTAEDYYHCYYQHGQKGYQGGYYHCGKVALFELKLFHFIIMSAELFGCFFVTQNLSDTTEKRHHSTPTG